jgi:predicted O-methyltransferase YrrM
MSDLFNKIQSVHARTEGWCSLLKAETLASIVVATRPAICAEIGCFYGKSLFPVALALRHVGAGKVIAIDPWMAENSVAGQVNPLDVAYWNRQAMHQAAYDNFKARVYEEELQEIVQIERRASDDFEPPAEIGLLHVDGNHGEQSIRDVQRYAPMVKRGGFLVADDLHWTGGSVNKAISMLPEMGFVELYRVENKEECWAVFERL